jgi:hypothetical protein
VWSIGGKTLLRGWSRRTCYSNNACSGEAHWQPARPQQYVTAEYSCEMSRQHQFDLSADGLLDLKKNGVPGEVIGTMVTGEGDSTGSRDTDMPASEDHSFFLYDNDKKIRLERAHGFASSLRPGFIRRFGGPAYGYASLSESGPAAALRVTNKNPGFGELAVPFDLRVPELAHLVKLGLDSGTKRRRVVPAKVQAFHQTEPGFPQEVRIEVVVEEVREMTSKGRRMRVYRMRPAAPLAAGEYAVVLSMRSFFDFAIDP